MYYVYLLIDKNRDSLYIGYTKDLTRRLRQHKSKKDVELIYYEGYKSKDDAIDREKKLKQYGSAWRGLKRRLKRSLRGLG